MDVFSATFGTGWGLKPRISALSLSPSYYYQSAFGVQGGDIIFTNDMDLAAFPFGTTHLESFKGGIYAQTRGKAFLVWDDHCFFINTPSKYMKGPYLSTSMSILVPADYEENQDEPYPNAYYSDIELMMAFGGGIKFIFNPGELLDFILGWTTLDIYGDDIGIIEEKKIKKSNEDVSVNSDTATAESE
jgi:hypothetical protein